MGMDLSGLTPSQVQAVQHLDGPLLVCAGAGTGKTFTLTQRIAWALTGCPEQGLPPLLSSIDEALVITYTNKAAAELKGRFRNMLRAVGRGEDALKVDGAWVSTIHGMCSRILREHALELGIDPEFELVMGSREQECLDVAINQCIHRGAREYQPLFSEYGSSGVRVMLEQLLREAACQTAGLDAFCLGPDAGSTAGLLVGLQDAVEAVALTASGKTAERAAAARGMVADFLASGGTVKDLPQLAETMELRYWRGSGVAELKALLAEAQDLAGLASARENLDLLLQLAREVEATNRSILAQESLVSTGDLIRYTLQAFTEHPEIAESYTGRFKLIMVDEFQDTSQLQIDMIERIAGPGRPHLCTVGDSQQSIYRFQGADVGVYLQHKRAMQQSGAKLVQLKQNFRSHPDVLAFVRKVCGRPGFFVEDFLDLEAASTGRSYFGGAPRVELALTLHENGCSDQAVQAEARLIASRFRALIDAGHKPSEMVILMGAATKIDSYASALREQGIPCMAAGGSKFFELPEVRRCISLLSAIANPYDSQSLFDVLSSDVLPVSSEDLLRLSTYYNSELGCKLRQDFAKGLLREDRAPECVSPLMQHAAAVLQRAWGKLGSMPPSRLLRETLVETGWFDRLALQGEQGQAATANIMKLLRRVQDAEDEAGMDINQVANKLAAAAQGEKDSPGVLSVEGLQAVRLMTVHASKGLEFPIVAVTNCFTSRADSGALRTVAESGQVYAALAPKGFKMKSEVELPDEYSLAPSGDLLSQRARICDANTQRDQAERRRLFYVAATRATDALIVALRHKRSANLVYKEVEADLLAALFGGEGAFPEASGSFDYGGSEPARYTFIDVVADGAADDAAGDAADAAAAAAPAQNQVEEILVPRLHELSQPNPALLARRTEFFSYSLLAKQGAGKPTAEGGAKSTKRRFDPDANADETIAARTPIDADKATNFGLALHRSCEWVALQDEAVTESSAYNAARRFAGTFGLRDVPRLLSALRRWLHSDVAARAYAHASCQPEVPFCTQVAGGFLEGEIDLLCTNGDGQAFVVDYKTGGSPAETPEALQEKHLLQAQCYAFSCLRSGYTGVQLHFVRVEQEDASGQPQVVSYAFSTEDLPALEATISCAASASIQ